MSDTLITDDAGSGFTSASPAQKVSSDLGAQALIARPLGVLASYWFFPGFDFSQLPAETPLCLDSGAFSAYTSGAAIALSDYASWLTRTREQHVFDFAFTLDVLGEAEASYRNWRSLLDDYGHATLPVLHYGARPSDVLPRYLDHGVSRIALGGLASGGMTPQVKAWCAAIFAYASRHAPGLAFHGLGIHIRNAARAFPWSTTDSSTHTMAFRYAHTYLWDSPARRWRSILLDGRTPYRHGALLRSYGTDPFQIARPTPEGVPALQHLIVSSEAQAARDWNASHLLRPARRYLVCWPTSNTGILPFAAEIESEALR